MPTSVGTDVKEMIAHKEKGNNPNFLIYKNTAELDSAVFFRPKMNSTYVLLVILYH